METKIQLRKQIELSGKVGWTFFDESVRICPLQDGSFQKQSVKIKHSLMTFPSPFPDKCKKKPYDTDNSNTVVIQL